MRKKRRINYTAAGVACHKNIAETKLIDSK